MRWSTSILVVSTALIASSFVFSSQDEPQAEQTFKNIQSFKGEKANVVIPAMEFMSAALKVDCDYCHTKDRASDEKPEKKTARNMIAMQRDINNKSFRGRNEVTCATCHAGHTQPVALPPTTGMEVRPRRSSDVKPSDVLSAFDKASVESTSGAVQGWKLEGSGKLSGMDAKFEITYSGDKYLIVAKTANGDIKQGFNGSAAWYAPPGATFPIPPEVAKQFVRENSIYLGQSSLPALTNPSGGTSKIGDKDMLVVTGVLTGESGRASLYFDKKTGLLVRSTFTYPTVLGNNLQINEYSNFSKVNGREIPMKVLNHSAGRETERIFTKAQSLNTIDSTIFDPPK